MTDEDLVHYDVADGVATVTLHNPDRKNAWSVAMEHQYFGCLDDAATDPSVRAIVVTGAGSAFCPGMDMAALEQTAAAGELVRAGRRPMHYALSIPKPMIAAINGACAGIGLIQALYCDLRFAARGARMSTSFTRRGLGAEYGTSWMLPRLIGVERALDLLLSGRTFDAEEAHAMGLVGRLCDPADVLRDAQTYAADLAAVVVAAGDGSGPPPGVRGSRRRLRDLVGPHARDHAAHERARRFLRGCRQLHRTARAGLRSSACRVRRVAPQLVASRQCRPSIQEVEHGLRVGPAEHHVGRLDQVTLPQVGRFVVPPLHHEVEEAPVGATADLRRLRGVRFVEVLARRTRARAAR